MPRVHTHTRRRAQLKHAPVCNGCGNEIAVGEEYRTWQKRYGGPQYRHTSCGFPRPSMLSGRKTAVIEDAIQDLDLSSCESLEDISAQLEGVASEARQVGEEYESNADGMPENLQYGSQAEAMREVASELEQWADELETLTDGVEEFEEPERDDEETDEDFEERVRVARDEYLEEVRGEAEDKLGEMPEYQG